MSPRNEARVALSPRRIPAATPTPIPISIRLPSEGRRRVAVMDRKLSADTAVSAKENGALPYHRPRSSPPEGVRPCVFPPSAFSGRCSSALFSAAGAAAQDETRRVSGLHAPVEVLTDRWGLDHIYAEERGRPVLRPGLPRRREPPVPVRDVAAAGDRDRRGHSGPVGTAAGHRHPSPHVPEGHGRGNAVVPPARGQDHPGLRARHQRGRGTRPAEPGFPAPRVPPARHPPGAVDGGGGDLPPSGTPVQREPGAQLRDGGGRGGRRDAHGDRLVPAGGAPARTRPGDRRIAAEARDPRHLPRLPRSGDLQAGTNRRRLPEPGRRTAGAPPGNPLRTGHGGSRGAHRFEQLGGARRADLDRAAAHRERPAPHDRGALAPLLRASEGAGLGRHRGRRTGPPRPLHRPQREGRLGPDGLRPGQRGPDGLRHEPRRPEPVPLPRRSGSP